MRLHTLSLTAFGPFAGTVSIDFDRLAGDGLFLINGPTGSGKTTILDAIGFALYGKVAGARNDAGQLRSQFASPSTPTVVSLEFSARGKRWKVERNPAYERPSKRGSTMVLERSKVLLSQWDGTDWGGRGRTMNEVQAFINRAIGLNAEQFTKIVLLPQGDFAAFLRADPKDREPILRKLFDTEHFTMVERLLTERAREARAEIQQASEHRSFLMAQVLQVHGEALPLPSAEHPSVADVDVVLGASEAICREHREIAEEREALAKRTEHQAQIRAQAATERIAARDKLTELRQLQETFDEQSEQRRLIRRQHELLTHVAALTPLQAELSRARTRKAAQTAEHSHARSRLDSLLTELPSDIRSLDTAELAELGRSVTAAAKAIVETLARRDSIRTRLPELSTQIGDLTRSHSKSKEEDAAAHARLAGLRTALAAEVELVQRTHEQRQRLHAAQRELSTAQSIARLEAEIAQAEELVRLRQDDQQSARAEYEAVRNRRIAGIAAELAEQLVDGEPCPVCGSIAHPTAAQATANSVTREDEQRAHSIWESRQKALSAAQERVARLQEQVRVSRAAADGLSAEQAAEQQQAAEDDLANLQEKLSTLTALKAEHAEVEEEKRLRSARMTELSEALTEAQKARAALEGQLEQLGASSESQSGGAVSRIGRRKPESAAAALDLQQLGSELSSAAASLADAHKAASSAATELSERESQFNRRLAESPFVSEEAYREAQSLDPTAVEGEMKRFEAISNRIAFLRESPWYQEASRDLASDDEIARHLAAAEDYRARTHARAESAVSFRAVARERLETVQQLRREFLTGAQSAEARLAELRTDASLAGLVQATSPDNLRRMSLSSYALVALFADVAANASARLQKMSRGRYSLIHDDALHKREKRAGLGLQVVDDFTQEQRDTRTLSGGESFMAALALALGLADTVKAAAGGIELDSLFIDEGFGSLDPDALAEVLGILDDLREGGRTIGVISHVQGMQQTIPNHITVRSSPTGSTISIDIDS